MKKVIIYLMTVLTLSLNNVYAIEQLPGQFSIKIPLELKDGGSLTDGSVIIGDGSGNNGGTPPTDTNTPTEPSEPFDCSYTGNEGNLTTYGMLDVMVFKLYDGKTIVNGHQGKLIFSQDNFKYYELCMNGEAPIYSEPPADPTDPTELYDCSYNVTNTFTVYTIEDGVESKYYNNVKILNGYKGKSTFIGDSFEDYEICMNGETPIPDTNTPVEQPSIKPCNYDRNNFYWREVSTDATYNDIPAFTDLKHGSSSEMISYNVSKNGVRYPDGYIATTYGNILPYDNPLIGYFDQYYVRDGLKETVVMDNGQTEYIYGICKYITY